MTGNTLLSHLFRTEFGKITAVLCKQFGLEYLENAEDIAGETFLAALETWPYKGVPPQPVAWLYAVAKNKAITFTRRMQLYENKISPHLQHSLTTVAHDNYWQEDEIFDSQLQMMFAVCHPSLNNEAQISLALRVLCGFSTEEIASAFLTTKETVSKRIYRAKQKFKEENIKLFFPGADEISGRLDNVLSIIYLLFNEGYYSESNSAVIREELCAEAIRLALLLLKHKSTNLPKVNALMSLMCFQASRFPARKNNAGEIILYDDQDPSLWNWEMISKGRYYLKQASEGTELSSFHLEAGIAMWYTMHENTIQKWENILQLYDHLLQLRYSPVVALNRTYVLSKVKGIAVAIAEAEKLQLYDNVYYYTLLGELYKHDDTKKAIAFFKEATHFARSSNEISLLKKKIKALTSIR